MPQLARTYGHIPGYEVGHHFDTRRDALKAGVHGQMRAGIHGLKNSSAFSICLSGGYADDKFLGDKITYVGTGGQLKGEQVGNQSSADYRNESLRLSSKTKEPVRVIRGSRKKRDDTGYKYEGLYRVDSFTRKSGQSGHDMCFYELSRVVEPDGSDDAGPSHSGGNEEAEDAESN